MTFILRNISWFHFCVTIRWIMRGGRGQRTAIRAERGPCAAAHTTLCGPQSIGFSRQGLPVPPAGRGKEGEKPGSYEGVSECLVCPASCSGGHHSSVPDLSPLSGVISPCWGEPEGSGATGPLRPPHGSPARLGTWRKG